ncbi:MAG: isoaspartyl peptidase/L-asparaginase [Anaerolineales bacterium]
MTVAMIVHGGAWAIPDDQVDAHARGCLTAVRIGYTILRDGGSALDAVEAAIRVMEDDPIFDAGRGSCLTRDGEVELDASLMDGATLNVGAVACVKHIAQPIHLARLVLESPHVLLVGEGAERFAQQHGMPLCANEDLIVERERAIWQEYQRRGHTHFGDAFEPRTDTVGAVALDASGNVAAGLSTGGTPNKLPGRVGDVPLVGCGFYADNAVGGVACTGFGEAIARMALAHRTVQGLEAGLTPTEAAERAIQTLAARVSGTAGLIVLDRLGRVGFAYNTKRMARAFLTEGMARPYVAVDRTEWKEPED